MKKNQGRRRCLPTLGSIQRWCTLNLEHGNYNKNKHVGCVCSHPKFEDKHVSPLAYARVYFFLFLLPDICAPLSAGSEALDLLAGVFFFTFDFPLFFKSSCTWTPNHKTNQEDEPCERIMYTFKNIQFNDKGVSENVSKRFKTNPSVCCSEDQVVASDRHLYQVQDHLKQVVDIKSTIRKWHWII